MALKEKLNKNDYVSLSPKLNRISNGYTEKNSINKETVKAAKEILAVLQDSPVKNRNTVSPVKSSTLANVNGNIIDLNIYDTVKLKGSKKIDCGKNIKKSTDVIETLNNKDIAGALFEDDMDSFEIIKKENLNKKSSSDASKNNCKKSLCNNVFEKGFSFAVNRNKLLDEEDIFIVDSSDLDDSSSEETIEDKVGEWTVTKSPSFKLSTKNNDSVKCVTYKSGKALSKSKVKRSLVSDLESPKANRSVNSPLRLKLKRKAPGAFEDEPSRKERKIEEGISSENLESRSLRCRTSIKLPKWRYDDDNTSGPSIWSPTKSISNSSSPVTPKTNRNCTSNVTITIKEKNYSATSAKENDNNSKSTSNFALSSCSPKRVSNCLTSPATPKIKKTCTHNVVIKEKNNCVSPTKETNKTSKKTSTNLLKSAEEIFDLLSTPEKKYLQSTINSSPAVKNISLKKSSDDIKLLKNDKSSDCKVEKGSSEIVLPYVKINKSVLCVETKSPRRSNLIEETDSDINNSDNDSVPCSPSHFKSNRKVSNVDLISSPTAKVKKKVNNSSSTPIKNGIIKPALSSSKKSLETELSTTFNKNKRSISKELLSDKSPIIISVGSDPKKEAMIKMSCSSLEEARSQLLASTVPQSLPCRDKEFNNIYSFISRKIEDMAGGCMYISGVPGTGKTATVHAVIKKLQLEVSQDDGVPEFEFVEINGLKLTEPRQAYTRIWQTLTGQRLTPEQAQRCLDRRYSSNAKKPTVLLVDELDYLCNRRQDVVYSILDWPTKQGSGLVILTIANTMDLPERTLKGKVTSRMGLTRLVFQPYTHHQLQEIVLNRLSGNNSFHPDAVQLVARKVAAVSGDARRALDICRRATELVDASGIVSIKNVEQALNQIFTGPRIQAIRGCSTMAQFVLRALRDETLRTGVDESNIAKIYRHLISICTLEGIEKPTTGNVLSIATTLENHGLIVAEKGRPDIMRKLSLNVSSDDIHYALNC